MTRLILVVLVGLINLGLGFAAALYVGRGPWSRGARQRVQAKSRTESNPEPVADPQRVSTSAEQIAAELEQAEQRFRSLLELNSGQPRSVVSTTELLAAVQATFDQFNAMVPRDELSSDARLRVIQSLDMFRSLLTSASDELQRATVDRSPPPDPVMLAKNLMTSCQEARGAFTALLFSDQLA